MPGQLPYVSYLELGDEPHLVAQECQSCHALYFDRRNACARCGRQEFATRRLADEGAVRAFTIVHRATPDVKVPYISAIGQHFGPGVDYAQTVQLAMEYAPEPPFDSGRPERARPDILVAARKRLDSIGAERAAAVYRAARTLRIEGEA